MTAGALPRHELLADAGLNRQHVFDLAALPAELIATLASAPHETQLLLFALAGRRLWDRVQAQRATGELPGDHPIDTHSVRSVQHWLTQALPGVRARFAYPWGLPEGHHLGLQHLGRLAGWHHESPFKVGVDAQWGSWFAYRAAVVTDSALPPSVPQDHGHPCQACAARPCLGACPAGALDSGTLDWNACRRERLSDGSRCALGCIARQACPVGAEHRYAIEQIQHSGRGSLAVLRRWGSGSG